MNHNIRYHTPVHTADGKMLGLAYTIYQHKHDVDAYDAIEVQPFERWLKVSNLETGMQFYVPLKYVDSAETNIRLKLTEKQILTRNMSAMPRSIAYRVAIPQALTP